MRAKRAAEALGTSARGRNINRERREYTCAYQLVALEAAWPTIDAYATELLASGEIKTIADLMGHQPLNQLLREFHRRIDRINRELAGSRRHASWEARA